MHEFTQEIYVAPFYNSFLFFFFLLVVCSVTTTPSPRPPVLLTAQTAVRSSVPKPVLTVRPPTASCTASIPVHPSPSPMPQRVLLSPDMQARLPCKYILSFSE